MDCVEKVEVLAVLVRLEIQRVEQLHESLVELGELDVGGASFDLALDNRDLAVLGRQ